MITEPIDYNEYTRMVNTVLILQLDKPTSEQWRRGQAYFNVLYDVKPNLADKVRGTLLDPFHNDARIPDFIVYVVTHWGEEGTT